MCNSVGLPYIKAYHIVNMRKKENDNRKLRPKIAKAELKRESEGGSKPFRQVNHDYKPQHKDAPPQPEQGLTTISSAPVFSSQKISMDHVTLEGIENRTGIEKQNLYRSVLKELLDNGIDPEETQYRSQEDENKNTITATSTASPQLEVTVSKESVCSS
jgi:hypothetical protein